MYLAATVVIAAIILLFEVRAFITVSEFSSNWSLWRRAALWVALCVLGAAAVRVIGFAEYPLPFATGDITGFGLPVLALATEHKAQGVLDFGGSTTVPAIVADILVTALLPVLAASLWLNARDG